MKKVVFSILISSLLVILIPQGIKNSKHNFSLSGKGGIKSAETSKICIFCHTSHSVDLNMKGPLWNRGQSQVAEYILYNSSTLYSVVGQPDGASKLCLSCHDGTVSVGRVLNRASAFTMQNTIDGKIPPGRDSDFDTNMSDDHPVSFDSSAAVSGSSELVHPALSDPVQYDKSGKIQCTSCHDPHKEVYPDFLVSTLFNAQLCKSCHKLTGYSGMSTHDISNMSWNGSGTDPLPKSDYQSLTDNSCYNCHQSHNAAGNERLLSKNVDSANCIKCHDGNTGANIADEIKKGFSHKVTSFNNIHDPMENFFTASIHVQCVDCHDPHKVNSSGGSVPGVNGRLVGVSGMTIDGSMTTESQFEYEVCLKCHGQNRYSNPPVSRQFENANLRKAFLPANSSFHAVAAVGTSGSVPSLRPGWSEFSMLYCTDCHNNNNARKNGGSGPNGPHGSVNDYILEDKYIIASSLNYQQSNYDLCWKCHRPGVIFDKDLTTFKDHKKHIDGESTPCSVCHDPHGSSQNIGLINFDLSVVFPNSDGELKFEVVGTKGYCYLDCHGEDHGPEDYNR